MTTALHTEAPPQTSETLSERITRLAAEAPSIDAGRMLSLVDLLAPTNRRILEVAA